MSHLINIVKDKNEETIGPKAHHSSFDDD